MKATRRLTNAVKETYVHGHEKAVLSSHKWRTAQNSAGYLLKFIKPGSKLLDVGCGPGTITCDFAKLVGESGQVVAIDTSTSVLDEAKAVAESQGVSKSILFESENVYELPYEDDTFDIVHAHQVLQHLSDPVSALSEMRRVVKPDGYVGARDADFDAMIWYPLSQEMESWLKLYRKVARDKGGEPDAGRRIYGWAKAAGFSTVDPSVGCWCFTSQEEKEWWGYGWADRVSKTALGSHIVKSGLATQVYSCTYLHIYISIYIYIYLNIH
ncbi:hypothetical protein AAMO2058_000274400 [Amorphochlora amoebiformis]